jgi:hypothetical protein
MPQFQLTSSGFPPGTITNGDSLCACSWADLAWAAITVGKRELYDVVRHGQYSLFEIAYRASILYANLRETDGSSITRSAVYEGLDPSEKAATSYFLGLTAAKLLSELYLGVPWLMHLDVYRDRIQAQLSGRSRPDLVGLNAQNEWVVVESKGRSGDFDQGALDQAKQQATEIDAISGRAPALCVGLLAHFSNGAFTVNWVDPSRERPKESVTVALSEEELEDSYYRPFEALLDETPERVEQRRINGEAFRMIRLEDSDLHIGLAARVPKQVVTRRRRNSRHREGNLTIGTDGIAVELGSSWQSDVMRTEPQERTRQYRAR